MLPICLLQGKLKDGRVIAVKKLSHHSKQGRREFMSEAKLLGGVQHRNVVALLGYCVHGSEKLLVYEYVSNESLDKLLFSKYCSQLLLTTVNPFSFHLLTLCSQNPADVESFIGRGGTTLSLA